MNKYVSPKRGVTMIIRQHNLKAIKNYFLIL